MTDDGVYAPQPRPAAAERMAEEGRYAPTYTAPQGPPPSTQAPNYAPGPNYHAGR